MAGIMLTMGKVLSMLETETDVLLTQSPIEVGIQNVPAHVAQRSVAERTIFFFSADEDVYFEGEVTSLLVRIDFGTVRVAKRLSSGRRELEAFYFAGDVILIEPANDFGSGAQCVDPVGLHIIRADLVHPGDNSSILMSQACPTKRRVSSAAARRGMPVARVANFLSQISARQGAAHTVDLVMPDQDIADFLGLSPAKVGAALKDLAARGKINICRHRQIEINDLSGTGFQRLKP